MEQDGEIKTFMHGLNAQAFSLNKGIVQKSATMQDIPLAKDCYTPERPQHDPQIQAVPAPQAVPAQQVHVPPQPQINTDPALLNNLIERVSSVEKHITKFVNLIEKQVARNAKEINIRIKLNNDSTSKE
tara:strand:- start:26 stop:412 length:387 start_codon:yes stop_codon:yes gene_type:complete